MSVELTGLSSARLKQQIFTDAASHELVPSVGGQHIQLLYLFVGVRNAVASIITIREGLIDRATVSLNATFGWWYELPIPDADAHRSLAGIVFQSAGNLSFQGSAATAQHDCIALAGYVSPDRLL